MKKLIMMSGIVAVVLALLFAGSFVMKAENVVAAEGETVNVVSVSGIGKVTAKPDIAYISIGVETQDEDASVAQQDNAKKMDAVMKALKAAGIKSDDITTTGYSIYDRYNYDKDDDVKYFVVSNRVEVTINDITKVGNIIDVTATAGANQVSNIRFGLSNSDELYAEALKLAMSSAKIKANAIMGTFGKTAGMPSRVSESSYYGGAVTASVEMMKSENSDFATPISTGELTIQANVSVEYNY